MSDRMGRPGTQDGTEKASASSFNKIGDQMRDVATQAVDLASNVAGDIQARGTSLVEDVKSDASATTEETKSQAAAGLDKLATELRHSRVALDGEHDWLAKLVESGAGEIGTLAEALRTNDLKAMLGKVEEMARRQPAVFVGVAIAVGFGAARIGRLAADDAISASASKPEETSSMGADHVPE